jgi:hypothetical protein
MASKRIEDMQAGVLISARRPVQQLFRVRLGHGVVPHP